MGFLNNLMGQKLVGTVRVKFYAEDEASVEYETDVSDQEQKEMDMIQGFALYYAKMLFNLNRGEYSDALIDYIQKAVSEIISDDGLKRPSILASASFLASEQKLVEPKGSDAIKIYSGELFEKSNKTRIIQTHMGVAGENYYAPMSTVMFLQWLVKNLSDGSLGFLTLSLGGMDKYYREQGDYADMKSLIAAPNFGISMAGQMINSL